ncbi:MAG: C1 family peptidase, partial [Chitinophagales bacterium]
DQMTFDLLTQDKLKLPILNQKKTVSGADLYQNLNRLLTQIQILEEEQSTMKLPIAFDTERQSLVLKKIGLEDKRSILKLLASCKLQSWETIAKRIDHSSIVNQQKLRQEKIYSTTLTLILENVPIKDQGIHPTSVAYATTTTLEYLQQRKTKLKPTPLSPEEIYHTIDLSKKNTRKGVYLTDALEYLKRKGTISQQDWQKMISIGYNDGLDAEKMKRYKVMDYVAMYNKNWHDTSELIEQLKKGLNEFGPLVTETVLFKNSLATNKKGIVIEDENVNFQYLQTICIVGYDDTKQLIKFRNSKGIHWGDKGYGYMSYEYAEKYFNYVYAFVEQTEDAQKSSDTNNSVPTVNAQK